MQRFYGDEPHIVEKRRVRAAKKPTAAPSRRKIGLKLAVTAAVLSVFALFYVAFNSARTETVMRVKRKEWYYVGIFTSADSGQATIKALDIRTRGGAGFIYNDGNFSVVASVYPTEREAKSVEGKQPDPATVIKTEFSEIRFPAAETDETISSALALPAAAIAELNDMAQSYEKGNLTESEVAYRLDGIRAKANEFLCAVEGQTSAAATYSAKVLAAIIEAIGKADDDEAAVLSSRLRYCACEIVDGVAELSAVYAGMQLS